MFPDSAALLFFLVSTPPDVLPPQQRTVCIIAHRGASAVAPENTFAAFRKAVELGADIVELDVHQSRDSQLVVMHDATVNRTTGGTGRIRDLTAAQIRGLDAGSWFSPGYASERVPFLSEVIDSLPPPIVLLIELKEGSDEYPGIESRVVRLIREKKAERRVILKSFEDGILDMFQVLAPDIPRLKIIVTEISFLGIIIGHGLDFGTVLNDSVEYLQHHWFGLTDSFIHEAHRQGYKVFAWDVHDEEKMRDMIDLGVDGIETDYPEKLRKLLHTQ